MKINIIKIIYLYIIYSLHVFSQVNIDPYIKVTSPNGGEQWKGNSTQIITWESRNIAKVNIEYSLSKGMVWHNLASNIDASIGEYDWTVLNVTIEEVLIRVNDSSNPLIFDVSDKQFNIIKGTSEKPQTLKQATAAGTQVKIMPLGDSITQGDGDDLQQVGYRSKLFDLLEAAGYNFNFVGNQSSGTSYTSNPVFDPDHEGHGGMEVGKPSYLDDPTMLDNIDGYLASLALASNLPDIILFHMGTNDLNHGDADAQIATQLVTIITDHILTANSNSITFLAKIIQNNHVSETNLNIEIENVYNALTTEQKKKIKLVDMHSSPDLIYPTDFSAVGGSGYNDLHPIRTGYDKMADKWFDALQNYFQPVLSLPLNNDMNQPVGITLNWIAPPAASDNPSLVYQVQISTDPLFLTNIVLDDESVGTNSRPTTGLLLYDTKYYWRVRIPSFGWSTTWNFTTEPNPIATCPNFMLSFWKLDESSSPYQDFFSGNDGTAINAPTPVTGKIGGAQSFDGVNDQITVPSNILYDWDYNVSFSFEFWMNHSTSVPADAEVILGRKNEVSSNLAIWVGLEGGSGKITFSVRSKKLPPEEEETFTVQGLALNDGLWHHVAAVRDALLNELRIYVDGVLKNTTTLAIYTQGFDAPSSPITIGWYDDSFSAYRYTGILDEVAIYNAVLSLSQIQNDYYKGLNGLGYCDVGSVPIITSSPNLNGFLGQLYSYDVDATGDPSPLYDLTLSPSGMTIDNSTGLIQWTPPTIGDYSVTVSASNGVGSPATQSFMITVTEVPECPANIISYWKLNENSGTTYTDLVAGNNGIAVNAPTPVTGQIGGAQSFDGVNDQISAPSNIIYDWAYNTSFSFEFWINHSTSVPADAEVILGRKNEVSSNLAIWVGLGAGSSAGKITFSVRSKKTTIPDESFTVEGPVLNDGLWHHVAAVRDASANELRIYVDGVLKNTTTSAIYTQGFDAPSSPITIGWYNDSYSAYRYTGIIDEVAVYNTAISSTQIQNDYIRGLEGQDYCDKFLLLSAKVFLEGPYDATTSDVMFTNLKINNLIPLTSPYSQNPRNVSAIPADVVDWVLVELRSNLSGPAVVSKSVFLHKDGNLVADDGTTQNIFLAVAPANYYLVMRHRNHLSLMSATTLSLSTSPTFCNFTAGSEQFYGGSSGAKLIDTSPTNVWGMISGDANGNGQIQNNDSENYWKPDNGTAGYKNSDFNLNGQVQNNDNENFWKPNNGRGSQIPNP